MGGGGWAAARKFVTQALDRSVFPAAGMPVRSKDLHGSAPDSGPVALLLIDVINDFEFEGGASLFRHAKPMAERIAALKERCQRAGVPVVYVNDNFGLWRSDFASVVKHCRRDGVRGALVAAALSPGEHDYFVLKPRHSGFYATTLEILLEHLGARTLILTGIAGDNCVFFTANDAYLRSYDLVIPKDCVASIDARNNASALKHMERVLKADTRVSSSVDLAALARRGGAGSSAKARRGPPPGPSRGSRAHPRPRTTPR